MSYSTAELGTPHPGGPRGGKETPHGRAVDGKHARYSATGDRVHETATDSYAGPAASSRVCGPEGPDRRRWRGYSGANLPDEEPDAGNPHVRVREGRGVTASPTRLAAARGRGGNLRETKPISVRAELELKSLQKKIYAVCARLTGSAKQSQFSLRCRSGDRRSRAAKRAKQSQFGPAGTVGPSCHIASMPRFGKQSQFGRVSGGDAQATRGASCETKPITRDRAEAMDVESATVCRPHPRPVAGHFLFESPAPEGV